MDTPTMTGARHQRFGWKLRAVFQEKGSVVADRHSGGAMPSQELDLKTVVSKLRAELQEAVKAGEGEAIRFELDEIDLELKVAASKEVGPHGTIKFTVLGIGGEVGGGVKWAAEQVQTVKLKMRPVDNTRLDRKLAMKAEVTATPK